MSFTSKNNLEKLKIYDFSYTDKKIIREINELLGKPYNFFERIKLGGIGSKRLEVSSVSDDLKSIVNPEHYTTLVSLEIRPKGILIYFRKKLDVYAVPMRFDNIQLSVNDFDAVIKCHESRITLKNAYQVDPAFMNRIGRKL